MSQILSSKMLPLIWTAIALLIIVGLIYDTAASAVIIWERSETFVHCFFVFPTFLWMVWRKRTLLATLYAKPDWLPVPLILGSGLFWLLSGLAGVQVGQHLALVMIIILSIWTIVGREIARNIAFPLTFLFFMAPVGEELVPLLMEMTADFTVGAIRLSGIPIYREGLFFSLPTGDWSVVEACSGIRYLIASLTLGSLYAYLNYTSLKLRFAFIALAAIVPLVANGIRAYLIVLIGHHSGMKLATGVDHLVYGWLFFGVVMFILFSFGAMFHDSPNCVSDTAKKASKTDGLAAASSALDKNRARRITTRTKLSQYAGYTLVVALSVAVWPAWVFAMDRYSDAVSGEVMDFNSILPNGYALDSQSLSGSKDPNVWQPHMRGYDVFLETTLSNESPMVYAKAFVYVNQSQGKEMINSGNVLVSSKDTIWIMKRSSTVKISTDRRDFVSIEQKTIESAANRLLVWRWYSVAGRITTNPVVAKLYEMRDKLLFRQSLSIVYLLLTDADHEESKNALERAALQLLKDNMVSSKNN